MGSPYRSFELDLLTEAALLRRRTTRGGGDELWCLVRRRWVVTQPEELVRQAFLARVGRGEYPISLMQLERAVTGSANRLDLLLLDRAGAPWLLAEFKSPEISHLRGIVQLADYARTIRAPYCLVANGREGVCVGLDYERKQITDCGRLPDYPLE